MIRRPPRSTRTDTLFPYTTLFRSIKANPHQALLRALVAEGFGLECVSLGELEHVFSTLPDLDPARVLFTPSFAPRAEYEAAFALGVTVTIENVEALRNWPDTLRGSATWLRIDLGRGDGHHDKRSEESSGGEEGDSTCRSRWSTIT